MQNYKGTIQGGQLVLFCTPLRFVPMTLTVRSVLLDDVAKLQGSHTFNHNHDDQDQYNDCKNDHAVDTGRTISPIDMSRPSALRIARESSSQNVLGAMGYERNRCLVMEEENRRGPPWEALSLSGPHLAGGSWDSNWSRVSGRTGFAIRSCLASLLLPKKAFVYPVWRLEIGVRPV